MMPSGRCSMGMSPSLLTASSIQSWKASGRRSRCSISFARCMTSTSTKYGLSVRMLLSGSTPMTCTRRSRTILQGINSRLSRDFQEKPAWGGSRFMNKNATKAEEEWRKELTPEQFGVLREHGTEPAFTGKHHDRKEGGTYLCAGCKAELFSSVT